MYRKIFKIVPVFQEFVSFEKMKPRDWTENYLSTQTQSFIISNGRTSLIKRNALVTGKRSANEGTEICSYFRPSRTIENFGGVIDMLNYNYGYQMGISNGADWLVQAVAIASLIRIEKKIEKNDPLKSAVLNLIKSFERMGEMGSLDERVIDGLVLAKAASEI